MGGCRTPPGLQDLPPGSKDLGEVRSAPVARGPGRRWPVPPGCLCTGARQTPWLGHAWL